MRERERDRQTDRQTDREREREREREKERQTDRQTDRDRQRREVPFVRPLQSHVASERGVGRQARTLTPPDKGLSVVQTLQ